VLVALLAAPLATGLPGETEPSADERVERAAERPPVPVPA